MSRRTSVPEEITAGWLVVQRLMQAYAKPDRAAGKAAV
jgi:hypothetical protein